MTEININEPFSKKADVCRIKKTNLRIDMTPMVDLGFLLISFFVFTTQILKPSTTNLNMPHDGDSTKIMESKSLTILLSSNDRVFYYYGNWETAIKNKQVYQTTFNEFDGLGNIIRQKQNDLEKRNTNKKDLIVLIKPTEQSSYKNIVHTMDEMLINDVSRYVLVDPEKEEKSFLEAIH